MTGGQTTAATTSKKHIENLQTIKGVQEIEIGCAKAAGSSVHWHSKIQQTEIITRTEGIDASLLDSGQLPKISSLRAGDSKGGTITLDKHGKLKVMGGETGAPDAGAEDLDELTTIAKVDDIDIREATADGAKVYHSDEE